MAIPFVQNDDNNNERSQLEEQQLKLMFDLYVSLHNVLRSRHAQHTASRNHRVPRQPAGTNNPQQPVVIVLHPGNAEDMSTLPLPDLVQSAMDQLPPPPSPHVTVSVPSSPMRDATFQFPECTNSSSGPLPSPRPRPRRRFASESSIMESSVMGPSGPIEVSICNGSCCHLGQNERQSWANVGTNLRSIAGDFHACRTKDAEGEKSRLPVIGPGLPNARNRNSSFTDNLLSLLIPTPLRETLWATMALYLGWRLVSRLR
ncbi:hypothetical protein DMN91_004006 [Ooceraea biroi]|uniref:Uncharacterized protein n=1 Tax=Ooceraea biroi TaxID=2015173 RepID=A0A3L8DVL5_OOCBI|nr:uncharacterized protein LOC105282535 [Ooceraea biroi]XP_011342864.1 uncharacterized protein LOC105282535 [Ooceraea biroi]XP_011342865.1 uncharacterized protein LOC105282535 [Ooceraea biroi]RLU23798.1 hypothetical protein DMN91_004006 [Ooceraea biroi]